VSLVKTEKLIDFKNLIWYKNAVNTIKGVLNMFKSLIFYTHTSNLCLAKNKFRYSLFKIICSICLILGLSACDNKTTERQVKERPIIKIGATLPLSGDSAEVGESARAGLVMVLDELNKGDLKYNYQLIFEDNQMNPQRVALTINKMINVDKVKAILSLWNLVGNVAAALSDKHGVFSLTCGIGEDSTKGKYNFNNFVSVEEEAKALVDQLKKRNIKTIALFIDNSAMRLEFEAVKKLIGDNSDIKVVFEEFFNPGEKDYRTAIAKASLKNPDMYVYSGYNPSTFIFMKQLKEITGRNDNVTSMGIFADLPIKDRVIVEGLWYVDDDLNGTPEFQRKLLKEKGIVSQSCTGNTVANLQILVAAYENAKVAEGEEIPSNEAVSKWIFDNVKNYDTYGGRVTVVREGLFNKKPSIRKMINGQAVEAE